MTTREELIRLVDEFAGAMEVDDWDLAKRARAAFIAALDRLTGEPVAYLLRNVATGRQDVMLATDPEPLDLNWQKSDPLYAAPPGWVKAGDPFFPAPGEWVLAHNGKWTGVATYVGGEEEGERWQDEHREFIERLGPKVTHWMAIPAAPPTQAAPANRDEYVNERDWDDEIDELRESGASGNVLAMQREMEQHARNMGKGTQAADERAVRELENFVRAKRFDRSVFEDDTAMVDWMLSRARAALAAKGPKGER